MKVIFFDIDETLYFTKAKIKVINKNNKKQIKLLDNKEYNTYIPKSNEELDFSEFSCSLKFANTSEPNLPLISRVIKEFEDGHIVYFLTARCSMDYKEILLDYMRSHGLPVGHKDEGLIHILRAGDIKTGSNGDKKKNIIRIL